MTRRITLAILLTVWAMLIASGATAYLTTRSVLLQDLDETLVAQASALPELVQPTDPLAAKSESTSPSSATTTSGETAGSVRQGNGSGDRDRYVIQATVDGRKVRPRGNGAPGRGSEAGNPAVIARSFSTLADGRRVRAVTVRAMARPASAGAAPVPVLVTYTRSAEAFHRLLDRLAMTLAACGLAGGLMAAGIARRVSEASLRPLRQTADLVGAIDERRLDRRIPMESLPAELAPVAERLNEMLGRLELAFAQRRQFLADASHELRTPVAALVTGLEVALARPRQAEAYRSTLAGALADASQLRFLVERLMEQVRSETFTHEEPLEAVDVSALIDETAAMATLLGEQRNIKVHRDYPPAMVLDTQRGRLRSVVSNVLSNAVEYNRAGGTVRVTASCDEGMLELVVTDTGPGIESEKLPHVFEPFFRGDDSHKSDAGHLGLGLFLVRSHLDAMGGRCTVESQFGIGSTFRVRVPEGGRDLQASGREPARTSKEINETVIRNANRTGAVVSATPPAA